MGLHAAVKPAFALASCLFFAACAKQNAAGGDAGEGGGDPFVDASSPLVDAFVTVDDASEPEAPAAPAGEATRTKVALATADATLVTVAAALKKQFGAAASGPFEVQSAALAHDRRALLVSLPGQKDAASPMPLLLVLDHDKVLWSKEMPIAGITPPVLGPTVTANARASVTLAAYDPPTRIVMARVWDEDGSPFADFTLLEDVACEALTAAYWPGHGVLVVASSPAGARAQLLRDDGRLAFARDGVAVGGKWRAASPASIVVDSPDTVMLAMHVTKGAGDAVGVFRYDAEGRMKWADPVTIDVSTVATPAARVEAALASPGVVRVDVKGASFGAAVRVDSSGAFVRTTK